jgi:hypothetical protein
VLRPLYSAFNRIGLWFHRQGEFQVKALSGYWLNHAEDIVTGICSRIRLAVLALIIGLAGVGQTRGSIFSEDFENEPENSLFPSLYGITGQQSANTTATTGSGNWWSAMVDNTYNSFPGDPLHDPYIGNPSEPGFSLTGNSSAKALGFLTGTAGTTATFANAFQTVAAFSTTLGELYDVFFDSVATSTINKAVLRPEISINGGLNWSPIGLGVSPTFKIWSSNAFQFTGSGSPTLFRISDLTFGGVGNDFMIDNVLIQSAAPEASGLVVWCLLGLTCMGLYTWRTRNRSPLTISFR